MFPPPERKVSEEGRERETGEREDIQEREDIEDIEDIDGRRRSPRAWLCRQTTNSTHIDR